MIERNRALFDDSSLACFGVSADPKDERSGRLRAALPGIQFLLGRRWQREPRMRRIAGRRHGCVPADLIPARSDAAHQGRPPGRAGRSRRAPAGAAASLPGASIGVWRAASGAGAVLDDVFEPGFRETLIRYQTETGSHASGIFAQREGRTQAMLEPGFKRRRDCVVKDPELVRQIQLRITRRVVPDLCRATSFQATRLERLLVACYDSREKSGFGPHRDNVVPAVAHRRFACSVILNDVYDGGAIQFPEFGQAVFQPPAGRAIVFSCSLLHEVVPVTRGQRFALLPFLFDEAAAAVKPSKAEAIRRGNDEAGRIAC